MQIIPSDMWLECLNCPHCYDDDEALYCGKKNECEKVGGSNGKGQI